MAARWLKRIGLALLIVAVVLVGAVGAALLLVDTEALKNRIERRVQAETGRELSIEGPLEVSVFPWVGFELGSTRLANAPGFEARNFLAFDYAELRVEVLPLLQRELVLDTVVLHGAQVNAARNEAGETNWADLIREQDAAAGDAGEPAGTAAAPGDGGAPLHLRVAGIDLRDARLSWTDAQNDRHLLVQDLDISSGALAPDRPVPMQLTGTLRADGGFVVAIDSRARVHYDPAARSGAVQGLNIDLTAQGPGLPPGATARLGADAQFDLAGGTVTIDPLTLAVLGTVMAEGAGQVRFGDSTPSFTGNLAVEPFSPVELLQAANLTVPERAGSDTLEQAALSLSFQGTSEAITIEPINASLDDTELSARAEVRMLDTPQVMLDLSVNRLDVDRYLPPEDAQSGAEEDGDAAAETGAPGSAPDADPIRSLPTEAMHGFGGNARLSVNQLQWNELTMDEVVVQTGLEDSVLELSRADMGVAGGRVTATGRLDARDPANPAAQVDAELADLQSEPLLAAFLDQAFITGRLSSQAQLTASGATLEDWTRSLAGNAAAIFRDGSIRGINIAQRLRMAAARVRGDELTQASETRRADFSSLSISARLENGIARSDDLDLRAPLLRASGDGRVNLPERTVDYTARIVITGTLEGQGGSTRADLSGVEVPLRISGPLGSPAVDLAVAEGLRQRVEEEAGQEAEEAEQRAREEIEQEVDETREQLEEELREGGEGLFE